MYQCHMNNVFRNVRCLYSTACVQPAAMASKPRACWRLNPGTSFRLQVPAADSYDSGYLHVYFVRARRMHVKMMVRVSMLCTYTQEGNGLGYYAMESSACERGRKTYRARRFRSTSKQQGCIGIDYTSSQIQCKHLRDMQKV